MLFAVTRGDGAEDQRRPAQELRRRLLRDERPRVRGRLHRRVADRRDRGDGPRRRGEHHPSRKRSRRSPTTRSATPKRLELAEEIRANIDPYIAAGHAQLDDVIDPADTRAAICAGPAGSAPTSASTARGASTACCPSSYGRLRTPTSSVSMIRRGASFRRGKARARLGIRTCRLPFSTAATTSSATVSLGTSTSICSL